MSCPCLHRALGWNLADRLCRGAHTVTVSNRLHLRHCRRSRVSCHRCFVNSPLSSQSCGSEHAEAQAPVQGVWASISKSQPVISVPAATDYLLMLRRSWHQPMASPQFNAGCRRLTKDQFEPDSGLSNMPQVERRMAALTSLGPSLITPGALSRSAIRLTP